MGEIRSATGVASTNSFAEALRIDALGRDIRVIGFRFEETGGSNAVDVKVQGTLNGEDWDDLTVLDEAGSAHGAATVNISAGSKDQAFIAPEGGGRPAVSAGYAAYRVVIKSNVDDTPGTMDIHAVLKE